MRNNWTNKKEKLPLNIRLNAIIFVPGDTGSTVRHFFQCRQDILPGSSAKRILAEYDAIKFNITYLPDQFSISIARKPGNTKEEKV